MLYYDIQNILMVFIRIKVRKEYKYANSAESPKYGLISKLLTIKSLKIMTLWAITNYAEYANKKSFLRSFSIFCSFRNLLDKKLAMVLT